MRATFPHLALWQTSQFYLVGQSLEVREGISGAETVVPTMRGRWNASASFALRGEAATLQWQAFLAQMQGRVGTTLVPVMTRFRPRDRDAHGLPFYDVANIKNTKTVEHFGLKNTTIARIEVAASAPLRATQLDMTLLNSTGLRPGQYFSIGERLHQVQAHWEPSGSVHRVTFVPPLRKAVSAGALVETSRPVCLMRMMSETEGLVEQALGVTTIATVNFSEAL